MGKFSDNISILADSKTYSKGLSYYLQNKVSVDNFDNQIVQARVKGSNNDSYHVVMKFNKNNIVQSFSCTCPCNFFCKHCVATLLELQNRVDKKTISSQSGGENETINDKNVANKLSLIMQDECEYFSKEIYKKNFTIKELDAVKFLNKYFNHIDLNSFLKILDSFKRGFNYNNFSLFYLLSIINEVDFDSTSLNKIFIKIKQLLPYSIDFKLNDFLFLSSLFSKTEVIDFLDFLLEKNLFNFFRIFYYENNLIHDLKVDKKILLRIIKIFNSYSLSQILFEAFIKLLSIDSLIDLGLGFIELFIKDVDSMNDNSFFYLVNSNYKSCLDESKKISITNFAYSLIASSASLTAFSILKDTFLVNEEQIQNYLSYCQNPLYKGLLFDVIILFLTKDDTNIKPSSLLVDNNFLFTFHLLSDEKKIEELNDLLWKKINETLKTKKDSINNFFDCFDTLLRLKNNNLPSLLTNSNFYKCFKNDPEIIDECKTFISVYYNDNVTYLNLKKLSISPLYCFNNSLMHNILSNLYNPSYFNTEVSFTYLKEKEELIKALKHDKYILLYKIADNYQTISHFAFLKQDYFKCDLPLFLNFDIDLSSLNNNKENLKRLYNLDSKNDLNACFCYAYMLKNSEEITYFNPDYYTDDKELLLDLSKKEEKAFLDLIDKRNEFLSLADKIGALNNVNSSLMKANPFVIDFQIEKYQDEYSIRLKIGRENERLYVVKNIDLFFIDLINNQEYIYSPTNETVLLAKENFKEPYFEALLYLLPFSKSLTYQNRSINVSFDVVKGLIFILKGLSITFLDRTYYIESAFIPGEVSLDIQGNIKLNPEVDKNSFVFSYNEYCCVLTNGKKCFQFIQFINTSICELFSYFTLYGANSFLDVKDIFAKKVLPKISSSFIKAKTVNKDESAFKISLYIELEENGYLHFVSKYYLSSKECNVKDILNNTYYLTLLNSYKEILTSLGGVENGVIKDQEAVLSFLKADQSELRKVCTIYLNELLMKLNITNSPKIKINVFNKMGWLDVEFESEKYTKEEIYQILDAYRKKKKFIKLGNDFIMLDEDTLGPIEDVKEELNIDENNNTVPFFAALKLESFKSKNVDIEMDDYIKKALKEISEYYKNKVDIPLETFEKMRPYQINAVKWLSTLTKYHLNGILADDMGLGKTLETIAFITSLKNELPILIVSPKSLIYNWSNEINIWAKKYLNPFIIEGNKEERKNIISNIKDSKKGSVYIISYDTLRNDLVLFQDINFSLIVLDEAQYIKNAHALKTKAVKDLHSEIKLALTGTPIENSMLDLWSIFDFLMPNYLGNFSSFEKTFANNSDDKDVLNYVKRKVAPFILKRTKEDVLKDLPPKSTTPIMINMESEQRKIYDAYLYEAREEIKSSTNKLQILKTLTRLRQICADPASFLENYDEICAKMNYSISLIKECIYNGHKILIFSSFTKTLDHLKLLLKENNIECFYINGATPSKNRLSICEHFNKENDVKVVLISLKAGGTGLNLFGADTVIHFDPWWNIAAEEQATDRAHRIGQTKPVQIYKLICHDTIEEKVIKLQENKKELYKNIINENDESIRNISDEDIKFILS